MKTQMALGFVAILLAGAMQGVFALPLKYTRQWRWENTWLVYSTTGMLLLPWVAVGVFSRHVAAAYSHSSPNALIAASSFGFGWGLGCVLCGLGIVSLGIALGSSIILGVASALGSLLPLVLLHSDRIGTRSGLLTISGVVIMLGGIAVCAAAGKARDSHSPSGSQPTGTRPRLFSGILVCVASGVLSAFINFGFAFGNEISEQARKLGNSNLSAVYPLLAIILSSGYVANACYCGLLLARNRSLVQFRKPGTTSHWPLGFLMGLLVFGGLLLYGWGASALGPLGTSAGWALSMSMMIVAANTSGFLTAEWKDAGPRAVTLMLAGGATLLAAMVTLGFANA